jgi:hypothetical protein
MVVSRGAYGAVFRVSGAECGEEVWEGALAGALKSFIVRGISSKEKADPSTHHPRTEKRSGPLSLRMTAAIESEGNRQDDSDC